MPIPEQRDPEQARAALREWLRTRWSVDDLEVSEVATPTATGFSNETLLFDAAWEDDDGPHEQGLVARIAPTGYSLFPDPQFDTQYRVLEALGRETDVRVPRVLGHETDDRVLGAPFFVMERVDGRVPEDNPPYHIEGWVAESAPAERERIWNGGVDSIASIHEVDWRSLGLDFLDRQDLGPTPIEQELEYYRRWLDEVSRHEDVPVAHRALAWLEDHLPDSQPDPVLSWGDARIGNIIFDTDHQPAAILDWEMVALGAPAMDVGWTLFLDRHHSEGMGVPRLEGFPDRATTIRRYEQATGNELADLEFHEIFGGFRFCVIYGQLAIIFKDWGLIASDDAMARDNSVGRITERYLDEVG